jgi:hypothetical protein
LLVISKKIKQKQKTFMILLGGNKKTDCKILICFFLWNY